MNLLDDPWIPCLMAGGSSAVVSLRQALVDAGRISRVTAGSALEDRAIERLLIAICWRAGGRDHAAAYLDRWHGRFELGRFCQYQIHPYTPKNFGLDRLLLDPAGRDVPERVDAAQAARALLVRLLWDCAGIRTGLADYEAIQRRRIYTALEPVVLPWISGSPWDHYALRALVQDEVAAIEPHLLRRVPEDCPTPGQLIGTIRRTARAVTDAVAPTEHEEAHQ